MATAQQVTRVRDYIAETDETAGWSDARISEYVDEASSLYAAAADIWAVKASGYAALVDVSESGSSRRMSSLQQQALTMEREYRRRAGEAAESVAGAPFVVPIRRK